MSPQHSNREALIEGALRCLQGSPYSRITTRQIAAAANASIGSIRYHFGSTESLLAIAMAEGFQRWLRELSDEMGETAGELPAERLQHASEIVARTMERHIGLAHAFLAALARAPHDDRLRAALAESYRESTAEVASLLGLGDDEAALHAASLVIATLDGLLVRAVISSEGALAPTDLLQGMTRLAAATQPRAP